MAGLVAVNNTATLPEKRKHGGAIEHAAKRAKHDNGDVVVLSAKYIDTAPVRTTAAGATVPDLAVAEQRTAALPAKHEHVTDALLLTVKYVNTTVVAEAAAAAAKAAKAAAAAAVTVKVAVAAVKAAKAAAKVAKAAAVVVRTQEVEAAAEAALRAPVAVVRSDAFNVDGRSGSGGRGPRAIASRHACRASTIRAPGSRRDGPAAGTRSCTAGQQTRKRSGWGGLPRDRVDGHGAPGRRSTTSRSSPATRASCGRWPARPSGRTRSASCVSCATTWTAWPRTG